MPGKRWALAGVLFLAATLGLAGCGSTTTGSVENLYRSHHYDNHQRVEDYYLQLREPDGKFDTFLCNDAGVYAAAWSARRLNREVRVDTVAGYPYDTATSVSY